MRENFAVIDFGSNLTKLGIYSKSLPFTKLHQSVYDTKTLKNAEKGFFDEATILKIESDLAILLEKTNAFHCSPILGMATSAFRTRKNGKEVIAYLNKKYNLQIELIAGSREAQLIYNGALAMVSPKSTPFFILDIGGGSTEVIIANSQEILWMHSFDFGSTALTHGMQLEDPLSTNNQAEIYQKLEKILLPLQKPMQQYQPKTFIGTTGAFKSLAQVIANKKGENMPVESGFSFHLSDLENVLAKILASTVGERTKMKGIEPHRAQTVGAAAAILKYIFTRYSFQNIQLSLGDVKEGMALEYLSKRNKQL